MCVLLLAVLVSPHHARVMRLLMMLRIESTLAALVSPQVSFAMPRVESTLSLCARYQMVKTVIVRLSFSTEFFPFVKKQKKQLQ